MPKPRECRKKFSKTDPPSSSGKQKKKLIKKSSKNDVRFDVRSDVRQMFVLPTSSAKKCHKTNSRERRKISARVYDDLPELTDVEREVLLLYFRENITDTKEIAKRRKVTPRSVQATINRIKKKGLWMKNNTMFAKGGGTWLSLVRDTTQKRYFLHGEIFKISILDYTDFFEKTMKIKKCIIDDVRLRGTEHQNKVIISKKSIEIHGKIEFEGKDYDECEQQSMDYWSKFISSLEQKYKIILLKEGYTNIVYTHRGHYGDTENDIAEDFKENKKRLQVRGKDGKVWLHTDNSNKDKPHFEFVHPETSKSDADLLKETFDDIEKNFGGTLQDTLNDIKDNYTINNPYKPSEQLTRGEFNKFLKYMVVLGENINTLVKSQEKSVKSTRKYEKLLEKRFKSNEEYIYELGESHRQILLMVSTFGNSFFNNINKEKSTSEEKPINPITSEINMFM